MHILTWEFWKACAFLERKIFKVWTLDQILNVIAFYGLKMQEESESSQTVEFVPIAIFVATYCPFSSLICP